MLCEGDGTCCFSLWIPQRYPCPSADVSSKEPTSLHNVDPRRNKLQLHNRIRRLPRSLNCGKKSALSDSGISEVPSETDFSSVGYVVLQSSEWITAPLTVTVSTVSYDCWVFYVGLISAQFPTIFRDSRTGKGLFSHGLVPNGRLIVKYRGERIPEEMVHDRKLHYCGQGIDDEYILSINGFETAIEATLIGTHAKYANDRCSPNARFVTVPLIGSDVKLGFIEARRDIEAEEEIFVDYGWPSDSGGCQFVCECGADNYREVIGEIPSTS